MCGITVQSNSWGHSTRGTRAGTRPRVTSTHFNFRCSSCPPPPAPIPSVITPDETSSQGLQTLSEGEDLNPLELFTSYEDTVNLIHNTTFNGYEFLEITQVESLIKQIPNESPYTDILHHEDEEAHVRGKALTKKN